MKRSGIWYLHESGKEVLKVTPESMLFSFFLLMSGPFPADVARLMNSKISTLSREQGMASLVSSFLLLNGFSGTSCIFQ